jgi:toxin ParE1/3/4
VKTAVFHPEALGELKEAAVFYNARSDGLGLALLEEAERALDMIAASPEACRQVGQRVRLKPLWRFPYHMIYAIDVEQIMVVAFAHQRRRPFYWRKRLRDC